MNNQKGYGIIRKEQIMSTFNLIEELIISETIRRETAIKVINDAYNAGKINNDHRSDLIELERKYL